MPIYLDSSPQYREPVNQTYMQDFGLLPKYQYPTTQDGKLLSFKAVRISSIRIS
jgi:hypothetical protein